MQKKYVIWKSVLLVCSIGILLVPVVTPKPNPIDKIKDNGIFFGDRTYYNATVVIISNLYCVTKHTEKEIILSDFRLPLLPGIYYVAGENGTFEINSGGWVNSKITITGFEGFFRDWVLEYWGLYVTIVGTCDKVRVQTFR